ncbi:phosphatidylglycerophosphatase A [Candidatus Babeliales bacterium]|nr:phosphatidylglycerophosphatase A [Candidatus Babeliales bacterium]
MNKRLETKWTVTLGRIGNLPASGTVASLVALIFVIFYMFFIHLLINIFQFFSVDINMNEIKNIYFGSTIGIIVGSFKNIQRALPLFDEKDPSEIVIDEVVGMLVTFWFVPINYKTLLLGFCLFRFFDISKPLGIKYIEKLPGAWGIILDDVAAALCANACLQEFLYYGLV